MTEKARKRIDKAIADESIELNLSSCELTEIPKEIGKMIWLEELNFDNNQLVKIEHLENLINLKRLDIDNNQLVKIEGLDQLINLEKLYISQNQITEIRGLELLINLETIFLHQNQITEIRGLELLTNLKSLSLSHNQITEIQGLELLTNLQSLALEQNQITEIRGLELLTNLQTLYLNQNQITEIRGLELLTNLQTLALEQNQITEIQDLEQLTNLQTLALNRNQITETRGLELLTNLKTLVLNHNPIKEIPLLPYWQKIAGIDLSGTLISDLSPLKNGIINDQKVFWERLIIEDGKKEQKEFHNFKIDNDDYHIKKGIYVKDCHNLKQPAPEWIMLGPKVVRSYFKAIEEQGGIELYEVKVLLIGDGGTGKTSLAYRLTKPKKALPTKEERTRGIDVYDWKYQKNKKKHLVHLWDFGGQVMYDMVHQYFYSQRSLYILLDSSRNGANENDSRLNQLLQSAELFGRESPMLMIQNEHTDHKKQMDFTVLQKHYPFLKEFRNVNLQTKAGLPEIISMLKSHISTIPGLGVVIPKKWLSIRTKIGRLQRKKSVIEVSEFRKICAKHEITAESAQDLLSRYFHQLGVFLHFQNKKHLALRRKIILHREWATKASYKVFDAKIMTDRTPKGEFSVHDLDDFWSEAAFKNYHAELLELMQEFEICFKLDSLNKYLVPRMMGKMPDRTYCNSEERPLHFYYEYTFMPEGLLNQLSVRLHERIQGDDAHKSVWNDGVVFEKKGTDLVAELREIRAPNKRRIDVKVTGTKSHWMSEYIIDEIDKINEKFNLARLKVYIKIACICSECQNLPPEEEPFFFDFREVQADLQKPATKFHSNLCDKSREKVEYHDLLKTISHKAIKEVEQAQKANKIGRFGERFSNEKESMKLVKKIEIKLENISDQIQTESESTRQTVQTEHQKTRVIIHQYIKEMPKTFKKYVTNAEQTILNEVFQKMDDLALDHQNTQDLIELVGKGVDQVFMKDMYQTELLEAFTLKQKSTDLELKEKLKVSFWIIPLLLKYEKELSSGSIYQHLKTRWKNGGFASLFVESV